MIVNEKNLVQSFYESHHKEGQRLNQSFLESIRGQLFSNWIGKNKKVLDLGGRDGTLTKYFIKKNNVTLADIDENALKYAKKNYQVETIKVDLNQSLPFQENSFDVEKLTVEYWINLMKNYTITGSEQFNYLESNSITKRNIIVIINF